MGSIDNCPSDFRANCYYNGVHCTQCKAMGNGSYLRYKPLSQIPQLKVHPASIVDKKKSTNSREGRYNEARLINSMGIRRTVNSGSVNGDGDAYVSIPGHSDLRVEIKTRLSDRNLLGPTGTEWDKAQSQRVSIFITSSKKRGDIVTMKRDVLELLLELIRC